VSGTPRGRLGAAPSITAGSQNSPYDSLPGQSQPGTAEVLRDVILTDTAINPGSSGGTLVDGTGRVVGITTAIATIGGGYIGQQSGSIGVGFAIPIAAGTAAAAAGSGRSVSSRRREPVRLAGPGGRRPGDRPSKPRARGRKALQHGRAAKGARLRERG